MTLSYFRMIKELFPTLMERKNLKRLEKGNATILLEERNLFNKVFPDFVVYHVFEHYVFTVY